MPRKAWYRVTYSSPRPMSRCFVDSLTYCIVGKQLVMTVIASLVSIARSAAIVVVDSSHTTAWPPSTNLAAARPMASFAATDAVRRNGRSLSNKLERRAVAPPRTLRSTPSASRTSRSRCTVIRLTRRTLTSWSTVTEPSLCTRSRITDCRLTAEAVSRTTCFLGSTAPMSPPFRRAYGTQHDASAQFPGDLSHASFALALSISRGPSCYAWDVWMGECEKVHTESLRISQPSYRVVTSVTWRSGLFLTPDLDARPTRR